MFLRPFQICFFGIKSELWLASHIYAAFLLAAWLGLVWFNLVWFSEVRHWSPARFRGPAAVVASVSYGSKRANLTTTHNYFFSS